MAFPGIYRLLLLALLPAFAILFYIEGQKYEPALINFQSSQSIEKDISSIFPDELSGKKRTENIKTYSKDNLYEYINGHAEYFISAGFAVLAVASYGSSTSENVEPVIVVDVYDMGKGINAFGVISDESGGNITEIDNETMGFKIPNGISFIKGRYYVKISSYTADIPLDEIAGSIANRIGSGQTSFSDFAELPDVGKTLSTRFIREAYRGLDFLNNVIERVYEINGRKVEIIFLKGDEAGIKRLNSSFVEYLNSSDITFSTKDSDGVRIYNVKDPYEGEWMLISSAESVYGIFGTFNDALINNILNKIKDSNRM